MITLEEAIKHCKDVALSCTNKECALEHFQLLKWLQEYSNMLAKQSEHKPQGKTALETALEAAKEEKVDNRNYVKLSDKVEPKFKVGDWVVYEENIYQIHNISLKKYYECLRTDGTVHTFDFEYIDSKSHLWTIQDAKDGDVLVHNGCTFIFMGVKNGIVQALEKYLLEGTNPVPFGEPDKDNDYYPATKEQRDALMKAMADVGYTFDFEKKELKKIEQKPVSNQFTPEQANILDKYIDKFLKQTPTWSEEDEAMRKTTILYLENTKDSCAAACVPYIVKCINWLKSLRPQNRWKPSDEQMTAMQVFLEHGCAATDREASLAEKVIESLYNDLKKLKGIKL